MNGSRIWPNPSVVLKRKLRTLTAALAVAVAVFALSLPVSVRLARAYPNASGLWDSYGCQFSGYTAAYSTVGFATTD